MTVKLYNLLRFSDFFEITKNTSIPIKLSYKIAMINHESEKIQQFYNQEMTKIINKYGARDAEDKLVPSDNGQGVKIKEEEINNCYTEINQLENTEVDVPDYCFSIDELESLSLTPMEVNIIIPFIKN